MPICELTTCGFFNFWLGAGSVIVGLCLWKVYEAWREERC